MINHLSYYYLPYILYYIITFILVYLHWVFFGDRSPMLPPMFFGQMLLLQNSPQYGLNPGTAPNIYIYNYLKKTHLRYIYSCNAPYCSDAWKSYVVEANACFTSRPIGLVTSFSGEVGLVKKRLGGNCSGGLYIATHQPGPAEELATSYGKARERLLSVQIPNSGWRRHRLLPPQV